MRETSTSFFAEPFAEPREPQSVIVYGGADDVVLVAMAAVVVGFVLSLFCVTVGLALSGCSTLVPEAETGIIVERHALTVPDQAAVEHVVDVFNENVPEGLAVDESDSLVVEWHAAGETFGVLQDGTPAVGRTLGPDRVQVSSRSLLVHELAHVALWRATGDPDYNHADPPGPWTDDVQAAVDAATAQIAAEGL